MRDINDLLTIMRQLRDPESGCPWDLEQTFDSIAPYTVEEAYEVADAIEHNDLDALRDELGDLLLQVVFHAQMASEQNRFEFADVVEAICRKMTRRHPHVFGGEDATVSSDEVRQTWQQIKREERGDASVLAGVPRALPALKRAQKLGSRAASVGFDWPSDVGAAAKLEEELVELKEAMTSGSDTDVEEEIGDLLFSVTNLCRHRGIDAEAALGKASAKFIRRFSVVEQDIQASDETLDLALLEAAWKRAKAMET